MAAVQFGGLTIDGILTWSEKRDAKLPGLTIPRRHGTIVQQVAFSGPRIVTVGGRVFKDSEAALLTYFDTLGAMLLNAGRDRLYRHNNGRYLNAICSGTAFPAFDAGLVPHLSAGFSIEFLCDDPFWNEDVESTSGLISISSSPHPFSLTNNGTIPAPIAIEIKATGADRQDVRLNHTTSGLHIRYSAIIAQNNTLIIDTGTYSIQNAGVSDLNNHVGSFFELQPGLNNLEFVGTGTFDLLIRWQERFV